MSTELYIVCRSCQQALWAGCDGMSGRQFLCANEHEMRTLGKFLYDHMTHSLSYLPEQYVDDAGYHIRYASEEPPTAGAEHE